MCFVKYIHKVRRGLGNNSQPRQNLAGRNGDLSANPSRDHDCRFRGQIRQCFRGVGFRPNTQVWPWAEGKWSDSITPKRSSNQEGGCFYAFIA